MIVAISDVVWQALIAAIVTLALAWMNQRTKASVEKNAKAAADKVADVKTALDTTTAQQKEHAERREQKLDTVAADIRKVEVATNSMKDALVKAAGEAGELKGAQDERDRDKKPGG